MLYLNRDVVKGASRSKLFRFLSKKQWIILFVGILFLIAAYFILPVAIPIITAFITALLLNPAVRMLQYRFKFKRKLSVIIVYIAFLVLISIIGTYVVTKVVTQVIQVAENADTYISQVEDFVFEWEEDYNQLANQFPDKYTDAFEDTMSQQFDAFKEKSKIIDIKQVTNWASKLPQYLVSFLVYLIALFLFMLLCH